MSEEVDGFADSLQWDCPMCNTSILVTGLVIAAYGDEWVEQEMDTYIDAHVDQHVESFADEMKSLDA